MKISTTHFGIVEAAESDILVFPHGIIGFASERQFLLLRHGDSTAVAWLQSVSSPHLALPVVSAHLFADFYPDVPLGPLAARADLGEDPEDLAALVVLLAPHGLPATVNLLAPIVVNASTRRGAQILLEGSRFGTREPFVVPPPKLQKLAQRSAEPDSLAVQETG